MGEVVVDDFLSFGAGDVAEALGEAEGRDTVRDAEVDHFSGAALIAVDLLGGDIEEACGGGGMDVLPGAEGFEESGILTEGGEDAELDLGVVGGEELPTVARDEGFAYLPASARCGRGCSGGWGRWRERRPVAVWVWPKCVCTRWVTGSTAAGRAST